MGIILILTMQCSRNKKPKGRHVPVQKGLLTGSICCKTNYREKADCRVKGICRTNEKRGKMAHIAVLGAGSWGSALASVLVWNGHDVTVWSHRAEEAAELERTHTNPSKLPDVQLPEALHFTADLREAVEKSDTVVFAVPSKAERSTAEKAHPFLTEGQRIITVSKGIEEETLLTQCGILEDVFSDLHVPVGILSGPSHAEEVIRRLPTVVVAGSEDGTLALYMQEIFMNEDFRVYTSDDVTGIELGGSLKNVIALAAGMSDGLGYGDNAKAALITRGIHEITELAVRMGGRSSTLAGLTGIGDLIVTCESAHSRNRQAGILIGQGMAPEDAIREVRMVVEGVYSAKAALALGSKYGCELPIISEVNHVLFDGENPGEAVQNLMTRDRKEEV